MIFSSFSNPSFNCLKISRIAVQNELTTKMKLHQLLSFLAAASLFIAPNVQAQSLKGLSSFKIAATNPSSTSNFSDQAEVAKPAVVRIENGCYAQIRSKQTQKVYDAIAGGFGSGYFVSANGYLVTNAHVVASSQNLKDCKSNLFVNVIHQMINTGEVDLAEIRANPKAKTAQILETLEFVTKIAPLQTVVMGNGDRLSYEIKLIEQREDVAIIKIEVENAPTLVLADSNQVRLAELILTIGFPVVADGQSRIGDGSIQVDPKSNLEATINGGQISARKKANTGSTLLQISAPVTHGNSGGPVLNDRGEVIGMVTFGPEESGFAFAVTSNTIRKLMHQSGAAQTKSTTNQAYQDALTLFRQGSYKQSLSKFLTVLSLFPYHAEAQYFIQLCKTQINARGME